MEWTHNYGSYLFLGGYTMKKNQMIPAIIFILAFFSLSTCYLIDGPQASPSPDASPTPTAAASPTPTPTPTIETSPTPTITPTPTIAPSSSKDITSFSLGIFGATISGTDLSVTIAPGFDVTALIATFTTTGKQVRMGPIVLTSGYVPFDYTDPVTITVEADDGSTKDYLVKAALLDSYEPNGTIGTSASLGTVVRSITRHFPATISPTMDLDYYRFYLQDPLDTTPPSNPESFALSIILTPPKAPHGANYDLYLYDDAGNLLGGSIATGTTDDQIDYTFNGVIGLDDSTYFRIQVKGVDGASTCSPYTLDIGFTTY
jgi:hypothetical protein